MRCFKTASILLQHRSDSCFAVETLVCRTSSDSRARDDASFSNSFPERRSRTIRRIADCSDVSGLYTAPALAAAQLVINLCFVVRFRHTNLRKKLYLDLSSISHSQLLLVLSRFVAGLLDHFNSGSWHGDISRVRELWSIGRRLLPDGGDCHTCRSICNVPTATALQVIQESNYFYVELVPILCVCSLLSITDDDDDFFGVDEESKGSTRPGSDRISNDPLARHSAMGGAEIRPSPRPKPLDGDTMEI